MGSLSVWHWLIVLAIVSLVFGTGKLRSLGSDLGFAIKGFKEGVKEAGSPYDSTLHDSLTTSNLFGVVASEPAREAVRSVDEVR